MGLFLQIRSRLQLQAREIQKRSVSFSDVSNSLRSLKQDCLATVVDTMAQTVWSDAKPIIDGSGQLLRIMAYFPDDDVHQNSMKNDKEYSDTACVQTYNKVVHKLGKWKIPLAGFGGSGQGNHFDGQSVTQQGRFHLRSYGMYSF